MKKHCTYVEMKLKRSETYVEKLPKIENLLHDLVSYDYGLPVINRETMIECDADHKMFETTVYCFTMEVTKLFYFINVMMHSHGFEVKCLPADVDTPLVFYPKEES